MAGILRVLRGGGVWEVERTVGEWFNYEEVDKVLVGVW